MNTLEKLHRIEKQRVIYDIHYCSAGVGFIFYSPPVGYVRDVQEGWKKYLTVDKYYSTFVKAVNAEFNNLYLP